MDASPLRVACGPSGLTSPALSAGGIVGDDVEGTSVELGTAQGFHCFLGSLVIGELNVSEAFGAAPAVIDDLY